MSLTAEDGTHPEAAPAAAHGSPPLRASAAVMSLVFALFAALPFIAGEAGLNVLEGVGLGFHPGLLFFTGAGGALVGALVVAQLRSVGARDPLDGASMTVALFAITLGALDVLLYFLLAVTA